MKIGNEAINIAERKKLSIPSKYKNKRLWSYSRVNEFVTCRQSYYLNRILKREQHTNIYSILGSLAHEINEAYYTQHITRDQMIDMFEEGIEKTKADGYRFSKDADKNIKMFDKYYSCVSHFYNTFEPVKIKCLDEHGSEQITEAKIIREKEVYADVGGNIFLGYIDQLHKDDGYLIITDDKTSSMYDKKHAEQNKAQLLIYGLALVQQGLDINKIKLRWHFTKYVDVSYMQKNGKLKTMHCERYEWVSRIKTNLKSQLKALNFSDAQIEEQIELAITTNSLDMLPEEVQKKYTLENCYVYVDINSEVVTEFTAEMCELIREIERSEKKGESCFERDKLDDSDTYWCSVLCGVNHHCKYYKQYLEEINSFRDADNQEENMYGETATQTLDDEIAALLDIL